MNKKILIDKLQVYGMLAAIIYISITLITWITFRYDGYTHFRAGDNNFIVTVIEWGIGFLGLWSSLKTMKELIESYSIKCEKGIYNEQ